MPFGPHGISTVAIGLILAWKVAGYYVVDRFLLPALGVPWRPGVLVQKVLPHNASTGGPSSNPAAGSA